MKDTNTTNTTNHATANTFAALIAAYNQAANARTDRDDKNYSNALQELATACAYSVLKKCINVGGNQALTDTRRDLTKALNDLSRVSYCAENATETRYKTNGNAETVTIDKSLRDGLKALTAENLGNGIDLVSVATLAIMEETSKQKEREPERPIDLERLYTVHALSKRVYIKDVDTSRGWKDIDTSPIREVYKAVRRYIMETASEKGDPRAKYTYLAMRVRKDDDGNDVDELIYKRLGKCCDLGGYVKDANGAETFYTVDTHAAMDTDRIISKLNLTAKQAQILAYRQKGYGYKAIATALKIAPQSVKEHLQAIQKKALAIGLTPKTN